MYEYETLRQSTVDHRRQLMRDACRNRVAAQARPPRVAGTGERTRAIALGRVLTERRHATT